MNVNLTFEKDVSEIKLGPKDSLLLIGKVKDLKNVKSADFGCLLNDLGVQESVSLFD